MRYINTHSFIQYIIPNFVAIALLVVLARNAPGTTSAFSSLLDPVTLLKLCFNRLLVVSQKLK